MDRNLLNRVKRRDRIARRVITLGGLLIVASVLAILVMIAKVALPLFFPARAKLIAEFAAPAASRVLAVGTDDALKTGFLLDDQAVFHFFGLDGGGARGQVAAPPPSARARTLRGAERTGAQTYSLLWDDGSLSLEQVQFKTPPPGEAPPSQSSNPQAATVERLAMLDPVTTGSAPARALARLTGEGKLTRVSLEADGRLSLTQRVVTTDFAGDSTTETHHATIAEPQPDAISALALDQAGATLYAGTASGHLLCWDLRDPDKPVIKSSVTAFADGRAVTALGLVFGDLSLAVGDARGGLTTWGLVATGRPSGSVALTRMHTLASHARPVRQILPSTRDKSLLSLDEGGRASLDHMTSERHLLELNAPAPLQTVALSGRAGAILGLDGQGRARFWSLTNPHPEISWKTLFGKVWYESYPEPVYAWQSSSASDDFEPKLSLVPLIFGTLKGTFYALLLATPLAVLGALYTSQFMRPGLRRIVKPAVEVMAAIPSVVIGFLAALWLAPRIERDLVGLLLSLLLLPAALLLALFFWERLERLPLARKLGRGREFMVVIPVILAGVATGWLLGPALERHFFGGSLGQWLFNHWHVRYDPRNCIIIAFALGFTVIPIIFTIADDALANIPRSLTAASLALGASRWQTAWRVVLPSASPGIFAGLMIGFGRAVGETMIVLMATGNTALLDFSPLNGMRTLAANIAVEIPEAPVDGTLYRVLFLTAVLLFVLTFALNTLAEIVRQRLRKRYGQL